MAEPVGVRNQAQLVQQVRLLLEQARIPVQELARSAGVSENTIRGMTKDSAGFPQQGTLERLVKALGKDPRPWMDAWHRANDSRPRVKRTAGSTATQAKIDELGDTVRQLADRVAQLTIAQSAADEEQADRTKKEQLYHRFLHSLPHPQFPQGTWLNPEHPEPGLTSVPDQPCYYSSVVYQTVKNIGYQAANTDSLPNLLGYLNSLAFSPVTRHDLANEGPAAPDIVHQAAVDQYLGQVRQCLRTYFAELAENTVSHPDGHESPPT